MNENNRNMVNDDEVEASPTQPGPLPYAIIKFLSTTATANATGVPDELVLYSSIHTIGRGTIAATGKDHLQISKPFISASHARVVVVEGNSSGSSGKGTEDEDDGHRHHHHHHHGGGGGGLMMVVQLMDESSNGTYHNGKLIGKGKSVVLQVREDDDEQPLLLL